MKITFSLPKAVLPFLKEKVDGFYLAGGTALSMFYFKHRESFDLDFFTKEYSPDRISKIIEALKRDSHWSVELVSLQEQKDFLKVAVYMAHITTDQACKIDFVEDPVALLNPLKRVEGIDILSLEDIYLRKIFAIAGHISSANEIGQKIFLGGRQEAKDFYDVYCLSTITMPLSEFASRYCQSVVKESLVRWYQTYDRMQMQTGLLDLYSKTKPDYRVIENHFKKEINKLLANLIGE